MKRRHFLAGTAAAALAPGLARPAIAQCSARVLHFVPQADLASPDPVWTTTVVAANHGLMVWDTLFGVDGSLTPQLQMLEGYELSDDKLTWTMKLRDGLFFHDGEPVRSIDCITSINRWAKRNGFGQRMMTQLAEMKAVDDKQLRHPPDQAVPAPCPTRSANRPATSCPSASRRPTRSSRSRNMSAAGRIKFLPNEWVSGSGAAWARFDKYVPRQETGRSLLGRQGRAFRPRAMDRPCRTPRPRRRRCRAARWTGSSSR